MKNEVVESHLIKPKDAFWQYVRGVCIICVVLIHCKTGIAYEKAPSGVWNFDYWLVMRQFINFPVAIFIFLSGYFTNIEGAKNLSILYISKRGRRLLIPFLVWSTFYTLVNVAVAGSDVTIIKTIVKLLLGLSAVHLYYILVLVQLMILTPFLIKSIQKNSKFLIVVTPIYLFILYSYMLLFGYDMPFSQKIFPAWFIFYYFGLRVKLRGYKPLFKKNQLRNLILCCCATLLLSVIEGYGLLAFGFTPGFASSQIKVSSFLYALMMINLVMAIKPYVAEVEIKWLKCLGDNSYGIYFVHYFWILVINKLMQSMSILSDILPAYQIVQAVSTLILSLISIVVAKKVLNEKLSGRLLGF